MDVGDGLGDDEPDSRLDFTRRPAVAASVGGRRAAPAPHCDAPRREPRLWSVALLAGLIASMLTSATIVAAGGFRQTTVVQSAQFQAPVLTTITRSSDVDRRRHRPPRSRHIADAIRPSIVQLDVQTDVG